MDLKGPVISEVASSNYSNAYKDPDSALQNASMRDREKQRKSIIDFEDDMFEAVNVMKNEEKILNELHFFLSLTSYGTMAKRTHI